MFRWPVVAYIVFTFLFALLALGDSFLRIGMAFGVLASLIFMYFFNAICFYFVGKFSPSIKRKKDFPGNFAVFFSTFLIVFMNIGLLAQEEAMVYLLKFNPFCGLWFIWVPQYTVMIQRLPIDSTENLQNSTLLPLTDCSVGRAYGCGFGSAMAGAGL